MMEKSKKYNTRKLVFISMFAAIILALGLVPNLGYIRIFLFTITIIHIPVIVGSIILGWKEGAFFGFLFGLTSMLAATFISPSPTESPLFSPFYKLGEFQGGFSSVLIAFVPRILVGIVAWLVYRALSKTKLHNSVSLAVAGVAGSLTNTFFVLGGIFLLFREPYSAAYGMSVSALFDTLAGLVVSNGVPEAIFAGVLTSAICSALQILAKKTKI